MAYKIPNCEVSRVTLAVVSVLLAGLEVRDHRSRNVLTAVTAAVKHRLDHLLVFPSQAAEENRSSIAFIGLEGVLHRLLELAHARQPRFSTQPRSFGVEFELAAEKTLRAKPPHKQIGISHRGLVSAAITNRPWIGPRRFRADP